MKIDLVDENLVFIPEKDLIASTIDKLRDFFREKLKENPGVKTVILDVKNITVIDSLGVNLIIGLYKQTISENKGFQITNAGEKFIKISNFFKFPSLFKVIPEEIK